ncbi:MAG: hypothetical protein ACI3XP_04070 [Eubacteriales bacterium]
MTKKILTALLAAALLLSAAACKKNDTPDTPDTDNGSVADTADTSAPDTSAEPEGYDGTLAELVDAIYGKVPVNLRLSPATDIDLTNADALNYYLGLDKADGIKEAVYSETMIGSQAFSMCVVRTEDGADVKAIAKNIFDNVNTQKWICVGADDLIVADSGELIFMIMTDDSFGETLASDLYEAFAEIAGATGDKLEK